MSNSDRMASEDYVLKYLDYEFMDVFHDYVSPQSLWRYQHRCRMDIVNEILSRYCDQGMVGLDAGSGKGPSTTIMSRYVNRIYSIEYEESNVKRQKENFIKTNLLQGAEVSVQQGDITNIPLIDESVDMIICSEVLEHIEEFDSAAQELFRVSKPGGVLILSMPNKYSAFWIYDKMIYFAVKFIRRIKAKPLDLSGYSYWERSRHWHFSTKDIRRIALKAGFEIVEERGLGMFIFNEWTFRHFLWGKHFKFIHNFEIFLGKKVPRFCGTYFLTLVKTTETETYS